MLLGKELSKAMTGGDIRSIGTSDGCVTPVITDTNRPARTVAAQPSPVYHRYEMRNSQKTASSWISL